MMNRQDFRRSLTTPILYWSGKTTAEVEYLLGKAVAAMVRFDQRNPHHCFDLFLHSLHTVEALEPMSSEELRVAAFFHDIGKPAVAFEKQNKLVFYGHAEKSAEIAVEMLDALGYGFEERKLICFYIKHHDDFINWVLPEERYDKSNPYITPITRSNIITYLSDNLSLTDGLALGNLAWIELVKLCEADADAQAWYVYNNAGKITDSKAHKLLKMMKIRSLLENVLCIEHRSRT